MRTASAGERSRNWGPRFRQFLWMVGIALVLAPIAYGLVGILYSRVVYYFVVGPILAVLWFPMAYAGNRWLWPAISKWVKDDPVMHDHKPPAPPEGRERG